MSPNRQLNIRDHSREAVGLTYVYPVVSRRARGVSIGINLNPNNACNWRCIYCQVPGLQRGTAPEIDVALLGHELRGFVADVLAGDFLRERVAEPMRRIADIAISGNGEPTSAARFAEVVALVAQVLDEFSLAPEVVARVITNGSLVDRDYVQRGLRTLGDRGGEAWFKVDAGTSEDMRRINDVVVTPAQVIRRLLTCADLCPTWVQTCMFALDGEEPSEAHLRSYVALLRSARHARLKGVLLYGLARPSLQPEAPRLAALAPAQLQRIGDRIEAETGLTVRVSP